MSIPGFVLPAISIGLGSIRLKPRRGFFPTNGGEFGPAQPLVPHATLRELHRDDLEITDHPVEIGAAVSDHAYVRPAEVIIECGWSNSAPTGGGGLLGTALGIAGTRIPAVGAVIAGAKTIQTATSLLTGDMPAQVRAVYMQLLELQRARVPFNIYTGKRAYQNMLFKSLAVTTEPGSENALMLTAVCKQVIIVSTRTVKMNVNPSAQSEPETTSPVTNAGVKQLKPALNVSNPATLLP